MQNITAFEIKGLFGTRDVGLQIEDNSIILVGPNGIGKSSVVNIFYLFISRQWVRLLEYEFFELSIVISGEKFTARREDISGLSDFNRLSTDLKSGSRISTLISTLMHSGEIEPFLSPGPFSNEKRRHYARILNIPISEINHLRRYITQRMSPELDIFDSSRIELDNKLKEYVSGRVLYLPTYRRIEKDINDIFPDFEERFRRYGENRSMPSAGRSDDHYIELVSFGMEDVKTNIEKRMQYIGNYSLSQYNNLSATYLRDVIRGKADKFVAKEINELTELDIDEILERVSEQTLPLKDKALLRDKVQSMQDKKKSDIEIHDKFLAHYFTKLVSVGSDISKEEADITSFVDVCNKYLRPSKELHYDEISFSIVILDENFTEVDLSVLSSGEKQIVSIFAHLYLDEATDQIVIIDEPELSLSVVWQKKFLPDIVESGRCGLLLAVTHSPFIYDNSLQSQSVDLRLMTKMRG